jgi:hypothetical protein
MHAYPKERKLYSNTGRKFNKLLTPLKLVYYRSPVVHKMALCAL